jgi:beta-lactamase class A
MPTVVRYGLRLLVVGIGVGVIAGTLVAAWESHLRLTPGAAQATASVLPRLAAQATANSGDLKQPLPLGKVIKPLQEEFRQLAEKQSKDLKAEVFLVDLDSGDYATYRGSQALPAASLIKIPILAALFYEVDAGRVRLDEKLVMRKDLIASNAGGMQYEPVGSKYSVLETATEMIRISDNTATNLLIDRLGGPEALNRMFRRWGLKSTEIKNLLADLEGTNLTSPEDLVRVLALVEKGILLSGRSRDRFLSILRTTETNTLLNKGLKPEAKIAHKTGDIASSVGDAGLIDMPSGKRYLMAAMVQRPWNDLRANELIRQMSKAAYQYLEQITPPVAAPASNPPATPNR